MAAATGRVSVVSVGVAVPSKRFSSKRFSNSSTTGSEVGVSDTAGAVPGAVSESVVGGAPAASPAVVEAVESVGVGRVVEAATVVAAGSTTSGWTISGSTTSAWGGPTATGASR